MSKKDYLHLSDEFRLSHKQEANRTSVEKLLRDLRRTDGRTPQVEILPDGGNRIIVDFEVTPQLAQQGYVSRRNYK